MARKCSRCILTTPLVNPQAPFVGNTQEFSIIRDGLGWLRMVHVMAEGGWHWAILPINGVIGK